MASFLDERESKKTFEDRLRKLSTKTKQSIISTNNSFDSFCKSYYRKQTTEILAELKLFKGEDLIEKTRNVLQNWIDWQYDNNNLSSTIKHRVSGIKRLLRHNGIKVHFEDFDEPLEYKPDVSEELHELTREEIQRIFTVAKPQKIGYYLALISTGARPSELLRVRKKDIDVTGKRFKIRLEAENTKTRSTRSVWLTNESSKYLTIRLRGLKDNDLVWTKNENTGNAENNEGIIFSRYVDKVGLGQRYASNKFRMITLYSIRSFFFGRAADVHREGYAHRMTGHGGYLPQYDRMSDEKKLDWFLELEPELLISNQERDKMKIESLEAEKTELEKKNEELLDYKRKLDELWADKERMETRSHI